MLELHWTNKSSSMQFLPDQLPSVPLTYLDAALALFIWTWTGYSGNNISQATTKTQETKSAN